MLLWFSYWSSSCTAVFYKYTLIKKKNFVLFIWPRPWAPPKADWRWWPLLVSPTSREGLSPWTWPGHLSRPHVDPKSQEDSELTLFLWLWVEREWATCFPRLFVRTVVNTSFGQDMLDPVLPWATEQGSEGGRLQLVWWKEAEGPAGQTQIG